MYTLDVQISNGRSSRKQLRVQLHYNYPACMRRGKVIGRVVVVVVVVVVVDTKIAKSGDVHT